MYPESNNYSLINSLLQQECDTLAKAAKDGDIDVIFKIINDGVDINATVTEVQYIAIVSSFMCITMCDCNHYGNIIIIIVGQFSKFGVNSHQLWS